MSASSIAVRGAGPSSGGRSGYRSVPWCHCSLATWHRWGFGQGSSVLLGALQTYDDAFYFSLVTFATLGYGDIVLAPGYRIFGALGATCGSLMLGWSTALIFAAISPAIERGRGGQTR